MVRERVWEFLAREAAQGRNDTADLNGVSVVVITGHYLQGNRDLHGGEVVVRYFPYHIGRMGSAKASFLDEPDMFIEDRRPYQLSRSQLTIERRNRDIYLVDPGSRFGSIVDNINLGGGKNDVKELRLSPGKHQIRRGGEKSPYVLTATVVNDAGFQSIEETIDFGYRSMPVSILNKRLCHHVQSIFQHFFKDGRQGMEMAKVFISSLLKYPEIFSPLYYYYAIPEVYRDVSSTDFRCFPHSVWCASIRER